ncbi:hypothetical protein [Ferviditalea candida]
MINDYLLNSQHYEIIIESATATLSHQLAIEGAGLAFLHLNGCR